MKKISTATLVLAIIALVAAVTLITLGFLYGAPRVTTERYGMYEMKTYTVRDVSSVPLFFEILGSALLIVSTQLFLFTAKVKAMACHRKSLRESARKMEAAAAEAEVAAEAAEAAEVAEAVEEATESI